MVEVLIDAGADIETKDDKECSPLHLACTNEEIALVKMLVKAGAEVCATDNEGHTCLTLAAYNGHTEIVRYLVGLKDVDVNHKAVDDFSASHAVDQNHPDVVEVLIDAGADIETKDDKGCSPLLLASRSGALALVKMLVKAGAEVCATDNEGYTCLIIACNGHTEVVRYLVGLKDVDVNHKADDHFSALHCAVDEKHPDVVEVLIAAGADIEIKDEMGCSPLLFASKQGDLSADALAVVKVLVKAGADVCATDNEGLTCLAIAALLGHTEIVRYLTSLQAVDVNHKVDDFSALHHAVYSVHPDVVEVLIAAGADIEARDNGRSPLQMACSKEEIAVVKMLVKAGAEVCATDNAGYTCLMYAACNGHTETVRYLVGLPGVDLHHKNYEGDTALAACEHPAVMEVLIDAGADIETKSNLGRTPLHWASMKGQVARMKVLVKAGSQMCVADKEGLSCLAFAAYFGHTEAVRYLVGLPEVHINQKGGLAREERTALGFAITRVHADVVRVLIDAGADIEAWETNGCRPLHLACMNEEIAIVKMLVKADAEVRVLDYRGFSPLDIAAVNGHTETVRYIVGLQKIDVNYRAFNNYTALQSAVHTGHPDVVQVLITARADIETKDEKGQSPLHWASRSGALAIVKVLVKAGAQVCATDNEGNTCLMLAGAKGHTEIVRYLLNLPEVDVKQTDSLDNTAVEAALAQCNAMKEEMKAMQEMMKSVMDQQKEILEAQKGVLGPTQHTAPVSEQPQQGGMAELRAVCAEMRETVRQCSERNTKLTAEVEGLKNASRDTKVQPRDSYYSRLRRLPHSK